MNGRVRRCGVRVLLPGLILLLLAGARTPAVTDTDAGESGADVATVERDRDSARTAEEDLDPSDSVDAGEGANRDTGNGNGPDEGSGEPGASDFLETLDRTPLFDPLAVDTPFDLGASAPLGGASVFAGPGDGRDLPPAVRDAIGAFDTDWSRRSVDLSSLRPGLTADDPRDLIQPIDQPMFETVTQGGYWLTPNEPGAMVVIDGEARFYPLSILTRHEIVNDRFGDVPVAVTFCPLCNTVATYDRRVDGEVLRLGVSGLLRNSDLVMWDDRTDSLWQQITGESIAGAYAGTELRSIPTAIVSYRQFAEAHPDGRSLSTRTGIAVKYGANPYRFYSSNDSPISTFYDGEVDGRVPALERVVGLVGEGESFGVPFWVLRLEGPVHLTVDDAPVVVWLGGETVDALDATEVANGRTLGTAIAWSAEVDGRVLTFRRVEDVAISTDQEFFVDEQTGSTWTLLGQAIEGPLQGSRLRPVDHRNDFWFAWSAFYPEATLVEFSG